MLAVSELMAWASTLDPAGFVGIDEDGLSLVELSPSATGAYLEVGGFDDEPAA
ncbi:hypothetical protein [Nocardia sp. MW-W600-9]